MSEERQRVWLVRCTGGMYALYCPAALWWTICLNLDTGPSSVGSSRSRSSRCRVAQLTKLPYYMHAAMTQRPTSLLLLLLPFLLGSHETVSLPLSVQPLLSGGPPVRKEGESVSAHRPREASSSVSARALRPLCVCVRHVRSSVDVRTSVVRVLFAFCLSSRFYLLASCLSLSV